MTKLARILGLGIALIFLSVSAQADTVKLVTLEYPPYSTKSGDGADGIAVRIVKEAFKKIGKDVTIEVNAWKRSLNLVKTGQADAIFTAYKNDERVKFLDYSETVLMPQVLSVWAAKGSSVSFDGSMDSISDTKIGLVNGISYGKTVDEAIKAGSFSALDYAPESSNNVKKLIGGRVDAIIMNRYGAMHHLKNNDGLDKVGEVGPEISSVPSYIAFSKANNLAGLRDELDVVLQEMIASGEYQQIIDAYFAE